MPRRTTALVTWKMSKLEQILEQQSSGRYPASTGEPPFVFFLIEEEKRRLRLNRVKPLKSLQTDCSGFFLGTTELKNGISFFLLAQIALWCIQRVHKM